MSRPQKSRLVSSVPEVTYFKPAGMRGHVTWVVSLSLEEAEAVRLKDLEGMEQEEAAEHMEVSRPTFQRILAVARRKIACALLTGKAIRIEGGNFRLAKCCLDKIDGIAVDYSRSNEPVKIKEVRMENRNERKALSIEHWA